MFSSNTTQVSSAVTVAEAVDFDGTNDLLSRANLTGNANGKTFTFSAWIYFNQATAFAYNVSTSSVGTQYFFISFNSGGNIRVYGTNSSGTKILDGNASGASPPLNTWVNILVSIDMASTSNRSVYVNDTALSMSWGATYTNAAIAFSQAYQSVVAYNTTFSKARFSNVYLDYTYRDMSVSANRRLFITADLKPASGQAALNPIVYLPMTSPSTVGTNTGTGGNFTLTGTVARSGRGPNQYNAPYTDFDGTNDYLFKSSNITGIANSKLITLQFCMNLDTVSSGYLLYFDDNGGASTPFRVYMESNGEMTIDGFSSVVAQCLKVRTVGTSFVAGRNYVITVSVDMSSTSRRFFYVNGSNVSPTWTTYTNSAIVLNYASPDLGIAANGAGSAKVNGRLGALWFNTSYIDLSVASNLAKFVSGTGINATPVDLGATGELPTGTAPLLYLQMYGNNAEKNYGTGGNFSAISGPYTGARGPNEFWGNKATFDGTTGRLTKSAALTGVSAGKIFSASYFVTFAASATNQSMMHISNSGNSRLSIFRNTSNQLTLSGRNTSNTEILAATVTSPTIAAGSYSIQIVVDLANSANRAIYINGTAATVTWNTYTNGDIALASNEVNLGVANTGSYIYYLNGSLSEFYFTTDYIDFSQEANRLLFQDAFGYPTNLPSAITALTVPNPAIYMRFPPTSFGTNSGTGGAFTVSGTITDGGQL